MTDNTRSTKLLLAAIIVSMFFWGLGWPSAKVLTGYVGPVEFMLWRYAIVVMTLLPILLFLRIPVKVKRAGIPHIVIASVLLAIYSYFFYKGLKQGMAGAGGVLVTTLNPIVAYTIGIFINRKFPSRIEFVGLGIGIVAGSILLKIWDQSVSVFDSGNLYFLAAAFTWAVMSVFTSKASRFGTSFSFSLWQYIVTIICIVPFMNTGEFFRVFSISDFVFWGNMIFGAVIVTSLATTVYFYATTKVGPEKASSFIFLVPFAAEISSWLFLHEPILLHTVIGGILGIVAVYVINRK